VRSGYRVRDAVGCGHAAHLDGRFPGLGTVVDLGQNMAVDVNHSGALACSNRCGISIGKYN
jgi:hypothetical protein